MSRSKTLGLAVAILIVSAFLVVAEDRGTIEVAAAPGPSPQMPRGSVAPLDAAVGGMEGTVEASFGAASLEANPYNNLDGVPTFGAFARTGSSQVNAR